ncbi:hypothetical protein HDU76_012905 [Blyttiomyces sp. JEL0837]|nr:hypothetical protein HDU76_012905 [Blyttiomyces sp. JEL0837]
MPPTSHQPHHYSAPVSGGSSYQGYVKGLHGWNDPPPIEGSSGVSGGSRKHGHGHGHSAPSGGGGSQVDVPAVIKSVENPTSHILVAMTSAMELVKGSVTNASQQRIVDDTDKRLEELMERLGEEKIPDILVAQLILLSNALNSKNGREASNVSMQLTLMSTNHPEDSHWIVGSKRLVELFNRTLVPGGQQ